jgi:adenylate kinase family enzyme
MKIVDSKIKRLLSQAFIVGGSPCSGKSTVARRLSREFKFQYYKVDDYESEHSERCDPILHPTMYKYAQMSWGEIWMRPVLDQVSEEFEYYRERFEMIVQDLGKYDEDKTVILEGAAYLPELIEQNEVDLKRVIFMVPTWEFQLQHYRQRPWIHHILQACQDPDQAFENWMIRDHLFGQEILRQSIAKGYQAILVDGSRTITERYTQIKAHFELK